MPSYRLSRHPARLLFLLLAVGSALPRLINPGIEGPVSSSGGPSTARPGSFYQLSLK